MTNPVRKALRIAGWILGVAVVAFVAQFIVWAVKEPRWVRSRNSDGAVIRRDPPSESRISAIIRIGAPSSDSIFLAERARGRERVGYSEAEFIEGRSLSCYSVEDADSLRVGRCKGERDSLHFLFACWPDECQSLQRMVARTIDEVLAARRSTSSE